MQILCPSPPTLNIVEDGTEGNASQLHVRSKSPKLLQIVSSYCPPLPAFSVFIIRLVDNMEQEIKGPQRVCPQTQSVILGFPQRYFRKNYQRVYCGLWHQHSGRNSYTKNRWPSLLGLGQLEWLPQDIDFLPHANIVSEPAWSQSGRSLLHRPLLLVWGSRDT